MGTASGLVFMRFGLPGGAVVGAMLGTGAFQMLSPVRAHASAHFDTVVQIAAGILIGLSFSRELLQIAKSALPWALLAAIVFLAVGVGLAFLVARFSDVNFATALFGLAPGGITGFGAMAQAEGNNPAMVGLFHLIRVITLFLLIPLLGRMLSR